MSIPYLVVLLKGKNHSDKNNFKNLSRNTSYILAINKNKKYTQ